MNHRGSRREHIKALTHGATLPLPVAPLPTPEAASEQEVRWGVANGCFSLAVGAVLARAAHQAGLRWWLANVPVLLLVGVAASVGGSAFVHAERLGWRVILGQEPSREQRFWARFAGAFSGAGFSFDALTTRLEGRSVWRGTYAWWWTIGWPLAAAMLFVNATEVQTAGRLSAEHRALTSDRTGLRNHYALDADLRQLAELRAPFTFVYFDLDGFKQVNDQLGHAAGDEVLAETAGVLKTFDVIPYHLHGDEFALLVPGHDDAAVESIVRAAFVGIRDLGTKRGISIGATFGAARSGPAGVDPDAVRHVADHEVRRAKAGGKRRLAFPGRVLIELTP